MKKRLVLLVMAAFMLLIFGSMAEATVANKQILVNYNNVKIVTNGKAVSLTAAQEPFLLNGVTYVPLRVAGQALNSVVNWDSATKTVYITGNGTSASNSQLLAQLAEKNQEIAKLKAQVASLEAKLDDDNDYNGDDDEDYDLDDIEENLMDDYGDLEDVYIDQFTLKGNSDFLKVEVDVDLDDYKDEWKELSERDIEDWLEEVVEYIQDELDDDTVVDGVIYSTDEEKLVEFYKKGKKQLDVDVINDYKGENASEVEDSLLGDRYAIDDLKFSIGDIEYDEDDEIVIVNFEAEVDDFGELWDDLSRSTIEDAVADIGEDIANEFEDEDVPVEAVRMFFYDEDDDRLGGYRYNVN